MRLVFAGTPTPALPSLQALIDSSRHEVVAVVTRPDAPAGRGRSLSASPVRALAEANGIDVLTPSRPSEPEFMDRLRTLDPDCCPVVAYGALIPQPVLDIPTIGWINLHFSLLPAWRGAAPVQRSIIAGDDVTGASTFLLEAGLDTGPVFGVVTTDIGSRETSGDLLKRLAVDGAGLLVATLDGIEDGTVAAVPQPVDGLSIAPKLGAADAHINWSASGVVIDRLVRGCTPEPGAWTTFRDQRFGMIELLPTEDPSELPAGAIRVFGKEVLVGTGTTPVALKSVKPAGRSVMAAGDWARGARLADVEGFS